MISNIEPYCRKCLNPNDTLYVEVRNNCSYYVYMSIEYTIKEKLLKKQSQVFAPGKFERLTFPRGALFLYLKIFDCSKVQPTVLCAKYLKNYISTCHSVAGHSPSTTSCVEVPC